MNLPKVLGVIDHTLGELDLPDVEVLYGGLATDFPDRYIAVLGTQEGDEGWHEAGGSNPRERKYSLGLEVVVGGHGLDQETATGEVFDVYETSRSALHALDIRAQVPSVADNLQVVFRSYDPGVTPEGRIARVTAYIRVSERG